MKTKESFMSKTSPFLKLTGKQHQSATHSLISRTRLRPESTAEDHGPLWWWPRIIQDIHSSAPPHKEPSSTVCSQPPVSQRSDFLHRHHHGMLRAEASTWDSALQTTAAREETRYSTTIFASASSIKDETELTLLLQFSHFLRYDLQLVHVVAEHTGPLLQRLHYGPGPRHVHGEHG